MDMAVEVGGAVPGRCVALVGHPSSLFAHPLSNVVFIKWTLSKANTLAAREVKTALELPPIP